jgi:hypothetical protein
MGMPVAHGWLGRLGFKDRRARIFDQVARVKKCENLPNSVDWTDRSITVNGLYAHPGATVVSWNRFIW